MSDRVYILAIIVMLFLVMFAFLLAFPFATEAAGYVVQPGDMSLWCIADDQGLNFWDLVLANTGPGLNPDLIRVGDVIRLPGN